MQLLDRPKRAGWQASMRCFVQTVAIFACLLPFGLGFMAKATAAEAMPESNSSLPTMTEISVGSCVLPDLPSSGDYAVVRRNGMSRPQPLAKPLEAAFDYRVIGFDLSPANPSAARIVSLGDPDNVPRMWDATTGQALASFGADDGPDLARLGDTAVFSPDGRYLVTGTARGNRAVWDTTTRRLVKILKTEGDLGIVVFSPDGQFVATGFRKEMGKEMVRIWNISTGDATDMVLAPDLHGIAFSGNGHRMIVGHHGQSYRYASVFSLTSSGKLQNLGILEGSFEALDGLAVALNNDGSRAITGRWEKPAQLWDVDRRRPIATLEGSRSVKLAAFSADGTRIVTAGLAPVPAYPEHHVADVWNAATGARLATLSGHKAEISELVFTPDGHRVITGSEKDRTIRIWDATGGQLLSVLDGSTHWVRYMAVSPDGSRVTTTPLGPAMNDAERSEVAVFAGSPNDGVGTPPAILWDTASGRAVGPSTVAGDRFNGEPVFSPDGKWLATGSVGQVRIWRATDGRYVSEAAAPASDNSTFISRLAFSPDSNRLAGVGGKTEGVGGRKIFVWDLKYQWAGRNSTVSEISSILAKLVWRYDVPRPWPVLAFSPDGRSIVTGRGSIALDSFAAQAVTWFGQQRGERNGSFLAQEGDPTRFRVATGGESMPGAYLLGHIWDGPSGQSIATLRAPAAPGQENMAMPWPSWYAPTSASFSPDGGRLITLSFNGPIVVWDANRAWKPLLLNADSRHAKIGAVGWTRSGDPLTITCETGPAADVGHNVSISE